MSTTSNKEDRWYIIHTYSGQEERVKRNLDQRVASMDVNDKIFQVVIPTEPEIEIKEGKRKHLSIIAPVVLLENWKNEYYRFT